MEDGIDYEGLSSKQMTNTKNTPFTEDVARVLKGEYFVRTLVLPQKTHAFIKRVLRAGDVFDEADPATVLFTERVEMPNNFYFSVTLWNGNFASSQPFLHIELFRHDDDTGMDEVYGGHKKGHFLPTECTMSGDVAGFPDEVYKLRIVKEGSA